MGEDLKPRIVVSGVNLVDLGPLSIYRDALVALVEACGDRYEIFALVQRASLFNIPGVTFYEFPRVKGSWLRRLKFEYFDSLRLSRDIQPDTWIAMHDITPRVECTRQFVYCHNPSPFYRFSIREAFLDPKFGVFVLLYRLLYRLFLKRNSAIIVQQDWIRREFIKRYKARKVIIAHPTVASASIHPNPSESAPGSPYRFLYPAHSRTFKNHELLLRAVRQLESQGVSGFEVLLTIDANSNRCGADLFRRYSDLHNVRWLGRLSRERVYELYGEVDCLVFPSKLETWGLPLTEFKTTGKPILAVDLPYAHETIGSYGRVVFFDEKEPTLLANTMEGAIQGTLPWQTSTAIPIREPYASDWRALWESLFPDLRFRPLDSE
jgi:glycosyltransferase involved in cell wall biosynthesis